jgi:predicted secreted protein
MSIDSMRGTQLLIKVGDGASPSETFTHPCLINAKRGVSFEVSTNKIVVPDCDNPDDPAWQQVIKDVLGCTIDGAGKLDRAGVSTFYAWLQDKDPRNVQMWLGTFGYWAGGFHCTKFAVSGDRGALAECDLAMESEGTVTFTTV